MKTLSNRNKQKLHDALVKEYSSRSQNSVQMYRRRNANQAIVSPSKKAKSKKTNTYRGFLLLSKEKKAVINLGKVDIVAVEEVKRAEREFRCYLRSKKSKAIPTQGSFDTSIPQKQNLTDPLDEEIRKRFKTPEDDLLYILTGQVAETRSTSDEDSEKASLQVVCSYVLPDEENGSSNYNTVYLAFDPDIFPSPEDRKVGRKYLAVISEQQGQLLELMNPKRAQDEEFKPSDLQQALFGSDRKRWNKSVFDCRLLDYEPETGMYEIECARDTDGQKQFSKKRYAKSILEQLIPHEFGALLKLHIYERPGARLHFFEDGQGKVDPETFNFKEERAKIAQLAKQIGY